MFPDSVFAVPTSSFNHPVPLPGVDPDTDPCIIVAFNPAWLPYILGSLKQLLLQTTWQAPTPSDLAIVQQQAFTLLAMFANARPGPCDNSAPLVTSEIEDDMTQTRIVCVNNQAFLEFLACSCPETWVRLANENQVGQQAQPGGGQPQPPAGGGTTCYLASNQLASKQWLLPAVVNSGDVLNLSGATGAASDNNPSGRWFCPDGEQFFAGACVGYPTLVATDPLPAVSHMRLLYLINGTYYDAEGGAFTVPGGVADAQVVVVPNTSFLSSVSGSYSYQVCVTNNQLAHWTHNWDFTVAPGKFVPWNPSGTQLAVWVAGVGWQDVNYTGTLAEVTIISTLPATITSISMVLNVTETIVSPDHKDLGSGIVATTLATAPLTPGMQTLSWTGAPFTDKLWLSAFNSLFGVGHMTIVSASASGTGTDPF